MYDAGDRHYYIDEVAQLKSGEFVIPIRWLEDNKGEVFADAYSITIDASVRVSFSPTIISDQNVSQRRANVNDSLPILIRVLDLQCNFLDLKDMDLLPAWSGEWHISIQPPNCSETK